MIAAPESSLELYLEQIRQIPMLSPQQEQELTRLSAAGDPEAIGKLVDANLRLVVSVAKGYDGYGVPLPDLIQEGSIGLLVAAGKFDPAMGCRFSTYATKWIRHGVTRCIQKHGGLIRVPQSMTDKIRKIEQAKNALEDPTLEQIAAFCDLQPEQVEKTLAMMPRVMSLEEESAQQLQAPQPQQELVRRELKNTMDDLLSKLTDRQREVLWLRFGMDDGVCHTQEAIGKILGISKERVRQTIGEAIKKLQKLSAGLGLEEFLDL